jgi:N-acetylglucosaminyl-diphospho-decaprenol L-rhamnosyltransferase
MKKIDVSIIVASYKNSSILKLCLDALFKNIGDEINFEVIVVDIETQEEIRDLVLDDYPQVKFIPLVKNVGFAKALNKGIRNSRGNVILSLNPDIIVKKKAVEILYKYIIKHPEAGIIGPRLLNFNGSRQDSCFSFYTPITVIYRRTFLGNSFFGKMSLKNFFIRPQGNNPQPIKGWIMGSALMLRRENLEKIGLMDERYFMYFEDVDWCRRFWEAGFKIVYVPQAEMFHYHGKMSASRNVLSLLFNKMTFIHFLSGLKYFIKFRGWKVVLKKNKKLKR